MKPIPSSTKLQHSACSPTAVWASLSGGFGIVSNTLVDKDKSISEWRRRLQ